MKRTVWAAVAVYSEHDDVDPIVVGHSKEAAENKLQWLICVSCQDQPEGVDLWIAYPAEEHMFC